MPPQGPSLLHDLQVRGVTQDIRSWKRLVHLGLKRVCASCKFQRICAQDLAAGDVESGMRIYCANAPVIDAMTVNWLKPSPRDLESLQVAEISRYGFNLRLV